MDDNKWMSLAMNVSSNSTCVRRHVGSVLVKDGKLLSIGCNHTPNGIEQCTEETCIRKVNNIPSGTRQEMCLAVHAEQNAIINAFKRKCDLEGSTIYVSDSPCIICSRFIINSGIKRVCYGNEYPDSFSLEILKRAGVQTEKIDMKNVFVEDTTDIFNAIMKMEEQLDVVKEDNGNEITEDGLVVINNPETISLDILEQLQYLKETDFLVFVDTTDILLLKTIKASFNEMMYEMGTYNKLVLVGCNVKPKKRQSYELLFDLGMKHNIKPDMVVGIDWSVKSSSNYITIHMVPEINPDEDYTKTIDSVETNYLASKKDSQIMGPTILDYSECITNNHDKIKNSLKLSIEKYFRK